MKKTLLAITIIALASCGDIGTSPSPSPVPQPTSTSTDPTLISHDAKISRSVAGYHYISWKFTVDSPRPYGYAYVEAKWFDADGFQIEWTNWSGSLAQGVHTYTDETMIKKEVWGRVVSRIVTLVTWL